MNILRFSAAAATYDQHARPQRALADRLVGELGGLCPARILELGAGTGLLTRRLVERFPGVPVLALDAAPGMVEYSRTAFHGCPQIAWAVGDAQAFCPQVLYPLIVSSAALHWARDLAQTFVRVAANLEPGGTFALGMMLEGTLRELRQLRHETAPTKAIGMRLPTFEQALDALCRAGFTVRQAERFEQRFAYADTRAFLRAIHEQGVTAGTRDSGYVPLQRGELQRLCRDYQARYAANGAVYASYETAVFLAGRTGAALPPRPAVSP
jgi:malonyl-CoA O-methyltransferase